MDIDKKIEKMINDNIKYFEDFYINFYKLQNKIFIVKSTSEKPEEVQYDGITNVEYFGNNYDIFQFRLTIKSGDDNICICKYMNIYELLDFLIENKIEINKKEILKEKTLKRLNELKLSIESNDKEINYYKNKFEEIFNVAYV